MNVSNKRNTNIKLLFGKDRDEFIKIKLIKYNFLWCPQHIKVLQRNSNIPITNTLFDNHIDEKNNY